MEKMEKLADFALVFCVIQMLVVLDRKYEYNISQVIPVA